MLGSKIIRGILNLQREGQYKVMPQLSIPNHISKPFYYQTKGKGEYRSTFQGEPQIHSKETIEKMRKASKIASEALQKALDFTKPGITTDEIDQVVHNFIISQNAYPSGVYLMGFPKSLYKELMKLFVMEFLILVHYKMGISSILMLQLILTGFMETQVTWC